MNCAVFRDCQNVSAVETLCTTSISFCCHTYMQTAAGNHFDSLSSRLTGFQGCKIVFAIWCRNDVHHPPPPRRCCHSAWSCNPIMQHVCPEEAGWGGGGGGTVSVSLGTLPDQVCHAIFRGPFPQAHWAVMECVRNMPWNQPRNLP